MSNPILSTAYLPPIEYFYYLDRNAKVKIEMHETFKKQTYRNRCLIYTEKGSMALTIPVFKPDGNHTKSNKIELFNSENWQKHHWKAINSAYQASPFFLYYKDELEAFYTKEYKNLTKFNAELTAILVELIGIEVEVSETKTFTIPKENDANDLRYRISPKAESTIKEYKPYTQVFSDRYGFVENLSIIDLLFNLGPDTLSYLRSLNLPQ